MPNSFLWIGLVVLWLFVLFPMLADRHPRIRQTTDAALATRVLFRGGSKRRGRGPASGHDSDPNWRPANPGKSDRRGIDAEDLMDTHAEEEATDTDVTEQDDHVVAGARRRTGTAAAPGRSGSGGSDDGDEFDEAAESREFVPNRRGRGGFDPEADAIARAARYSFRQRAVLGLILTAIMTAGLAVVISTTMWWACGLAVVILGGYLTYLRKQVRLEEDIRRRRMARLGRARLGVESREDEELRLVPARLRRPGAVVVEIDDEDPVFDHLDHFDEAAIDRTTQGRPAAGMRRAAGE
ncbi:gephyrin-like molybdotransferase receptor GlpR [Antrihabitans spumae]|uniref:Gephyrin-like molybdotransferase receptor GlpR n=1 Tax=Antrihabitans spumae TaxID=3373370 RepID=A0ABW7K278_9NOCA